MQFTINPSLNNLEHTVDVIQFFSDLEKFSYIVDRETNEVEFFFISPAGEVLDGVINYRLNGKSELFEAIQVSDSSSVEFDRKVIYRMSIGQKNIHEVYKKILPSDYTPTVGEGILKNSSSDAYITKSSYETVILRDTTEGHYLDEKGRIQLTTTDYYKIYKSLEIVCKRNGEELTRQKGNNFYCSGNKLLVGSYVTISGKCTYDLYDINGVLLEKDVVEVTPYIRIKNLSTKKLEAELGKVTFPDDTSYNYTYRGIIYYEDLDGTVKSVESSNYLTLVKYKLGEINADVDTVEYSEGNYPLYIVGPKKGNSISFWAKLEFVNSSAAPDTISVTQFTGSSSFGQSIINQIFEFTYKSEGSIVYDNTKGRLKVTITAKEDNEETEPWRPQYTKVLPLLNKTSIHYSYKDGNGTTRTGSLDFDYYVIQKSKKLGIIPIQYPSHEANTYTICDYSEVLGGYIAKIPGMVGIKKIFLGVTAEVDPYKSVFDTWTIDEPTETRRNREYFFTNYSGSYDDKIVLYTTSSKSGEYLNYFTISDHVTQSDLWRRAIYESTVKVFPYIVEVETTLGLIKYKITSSTGYVYNNSRLYLFNEDNKDLNPAGETLPPLGSNYFNLDAYSDSEISISLAQLKLNDQTVYDEGIWKKSEIEEDNGALVGGIDDVTNKLKFSCDGEGNFKIYDTSQSSTNPEEILNLSIEEKVNEIGKLNYQFNLIYPPETSLFGQDENGIALINNGGLTIKFKLEGDGGDYGLQSERFFCAREKTFPLGILSTEGDVFKYNSDEAFVTVEVPYVNVEGEGEQGGEYNGRYYVVSPVTDSDLPNWDFTEIPKTFEFEKPEIANRRVSRVNESWISDENLNSNENLVVRREESTGGYDLINMYRIDESLEKSLSKWKFYIYNRFPSLFRFSSGIGGSNLITVYTAIGGNPISELHLSKIGIYNIFIRVDTNEEIIEGKNASLSIKNNSSNIELEYYHSGNNWSTLTGTGNEISRKSYNGDDYNGSMAVQVLLRYKGGEVEVEDGSYLEIEYNINSNTKYTTSILLTQGIGGDITAEQLSIDYLDSSDQKIETTDSSFRSQRPTFIPLINNQAGSIRFNINKQYPYLPNAGLDLVPPSSTYYYETKSSNIKEVFTLSQPTFYIADTVEIIPNEETNDNTIKLYTGQGGEEVEYELNTDTGYFKGSFLGSSVVLGIKNGNTSANVVTADFRIGSNSLDTYIHYLPPYSAESFSVRPAGDSNSSHSYVTQPQSGSIGVITDIDEPYHNIPLGKDINSKNKIQIFGPDYLDVDTTNITLYKIPYPTYDGPDISSASDIVSIQRKSFNESPGQALVDQAGVFEITAKSDTYAAQLANSQGENGAKIINIAAFDLPIKLNWSWWATETVDINYFNSLIQGNLTLGKYVISQHCRNSIIYLEMDSLPAIPKTYSESSLAQYFNKTDQECLNNDILKIEIPQRYFNVVNEGNGNHTIRIYRQGSNSGNKIFAQCSCKWSSSNTASIDATNLSNIEFTANSHEIGNVYLLLSFKNIEDIHIKPESGSNIEEISTSVTTNAPGYCIKNSGGETLLNRFISDSPITYTIKLKIDGQYETLDVTQKVFTYAIEVIAANSSYATNGANIGSVTSLRYNYTTSDFREYIILPTHINQLFNNTMRVFYLYTNPDSPKPGTFSGSSVEFQGLVFCNCIGGRQDKDGIFKFSIEEINVNFCSYGRTIKKVTEAVGGDLPVFEQTTSGWHGYCGGQNEDGSWKWRLQGDSGNDVEGNPHDDSEYGAFAYPLTGGDSGMYNKIIVTRGTETREIYVRTVN